MLKSLIWAISLSLAGTAAMADDGPRFLNRTGQTIVKLQLAPAGTKKWGPDQCVHDDEGAVDHNEKLTLVGVNSGRYDLQIADKNGRVCIAKNIEVTQGVQFSVKEQDLTDCTK